MTSPPYLTQHTHIFQHADEEVDRVDCHVAHGPKRTELDRLSYAITTAANELFATLWSSSIVHLLHLLRGLRIVHHALRHTPYSIAQRS